MTPVSSRRRALLAGAAALLARPALAQGTRAAGRPFTVAQIHDTSTAEQDVSKDFLIGARAAWQDINARGGVRGRPVEHLSIEVDGSSARLQEAWRTVRDNPACLLLSGTAGDAAATELAALLRRDEAAIAHAAPWLQNSSLEIDERTFPIFAGRQEQIAHVLRSLSVSGMTEVGAVFASARERQRYGADVARAGEAVRLKIAASTAEGNLAQLGLRMGPATPAVLLFVGGTPELVQFTQGLERQARQRYVIALADVNLNTLGQLGAGGTTAIIGAQAVPMVTAALPVVRRYRAVLGRLFDEAPAALSLAGFVGARYAFEVLEGIEAPLTRASVLAAFQRRAEVDLGGFRVSFDRQRRSAGFVTQGMLAADGRVLG